MTKIFYLTVFLFLILSIKTTAQTTDSLREKIQQIIAAKNATVGVSISSGDQKDTLSINGDKHFPLQSVYKFHIALVVLSQIDKGKFSLDQKIQIKKENLLPGLYSPIRDKYPNGATLTMAEILKYIVSESDNVGCDILLKLIGGPKVVESFFKKKNIRDLSIKINEEVMQANWDLQYQNWTTPRAAAEVLVKFYKNKSNLLSSKSYNFIWQIMKATNTGKYRLKNKLPSNIVVAHKTGTSGTNKLGLTAAVNDIGIVFLPNGHYYFISVFVTNSKEDEIANDEIISNISKACYDYFLEKKNINTPYNLMTLS